MSRTVGIGVAIACMLGWAGTQAVRADYIFYSDPADFYADAPGLPLETFESFSVPPGTYLLGPGPLDSNAVGTAVLRPGISLTAGAIGGGGTVPIVITGIGTTPGGTQQVGAALSGAPLDIAFTTPVTAAGFQIISSPGPGSVSSANADVTLFNSGGQVGVSSLAVSGLQTFFGVRSTAGPITHISVNFQSLVGSSFVLIDNLSFGIPAAAAAPQTYSKRSDFDAGNPGLSVETFDASIVGQGWLFFSGDFNATTASGFGNNQPYLPGTLKAGFTARSVGSADTRLFVAGNNSFPISQPTARIGEVAVGNALELAFDQSPTAVGFDLFDSGNPGTITSGTFLVNVYSGTQLIETMTVGVPVDGSFFGVTSALPITRIDISNSSANGSVFIDNLAFGSASPVPEPASLAFLIGSLPVLLRCRRSRRE